jgi:hypothetical protein
MPKKQSKADDEDLALADPQYSLRVLTVTYSVDNGCPKELLIVCISTTGQNIDLMLLISW